MTETDELLRATVVAHVAPNAELVAVHEHDGGAQGFSGATLRYYDVEFVHAGDAGHVSRVTKNVPLAERRTQMWLSEQSLPVPFSHTLDLTTAVPAPLCMAYVGEKPAPGPETARLAARALAAIHAAAMGRGNALPWVPRADPSFFAQSLVRTSWRDPWYRALVGPEQIAEYAVQSGFAWGTVKPGGDFAAAFAADTPLLEAAADRFLHAMTTLWDAGDTLTLLHADLHGEHVRIRDGRGYVLDWGQARYGSLFVDLPNYFSRENALLYRDALAALGHDIPHDAFLAGYDAASAYPGFKYFGFAFRDWFCGDTPHRPEAVRYWVNMVTRGADKNRW